MQTATQIETLCDHPELMPVVASLIHQEWSHEFEGQSLAAWLEQFAASEGTSRTTFVALEGKNLLGTACLDAQDLPDRPDLSPWLASVYVTPVARSRGLGSRLVQQVEAHAWTNGVARLHLHTSDHEGFYARRGWRSLEHLQVWKTKVALMCKENPHVG